MKRAVFLAAIITTMYVTAGMAAMGGSETRPYDPSARQILAQSQGAAQNAGETPAQQTRTTAAALRAAALHSGLNPLQSGQEVKQQSQATPMQQQGTIAEQVQTATVTLVVRDQSGAPVKNADVQIRPVGLSFVTDENGTVELHLSRGKYGFLVNAAGFAPAHAYLDLRDTKPHTVNIVVRPAPEFNPRLMATLVAAHTQQSQATPMQRAGQQETTRNAGETPALQTPGKPAPMVPRKVAITFDDLPAFESNDLNGTQIDAQNERLLATLDREKIPAIGFVNEVKLYKWGEVDERIKALRMWLDDGFELGNHTYSHVSLNKVGLQAWEENVVEGEPVLKLLLAQHHMTLRYFRHPFLDTGPDLLTRRQAEQFLSSRGYTVAPVTIDVGDWEFAPVYYDAKRKGDTAEENRVVAAFLDYANESLDYAERFSKQIIGYEPMQVILLHDSQLEADHFADLAAVMRKRNYSFITLDEALEDSAYNLPNNYAGGGTSWLDQWAITEGKMPPNEPQLPEWVAQRLAALH